MQRFGFSLLTAVVLAAAGCVTGETVPDRNPPPEPDAAQTLGSAVLLPECRTHPAPFCGELLIYGRDILLRGGAHRSRRTARSA